MSAFMNALREEGTKEDCLIPIERLLDRLQATEARLAEAVEVMRTIVGLLSSSFAASIIDSADERVLGRARDFLAKLESKP